MNAGHTASSSAAKPHAAARGPAFAGPPKPFRKRQYGVSCSVCRQRKIKCEGAHSPPCKQCVRSNIVCDAGGRAVPTQAQAPVSEALTASLERHEARLRSLEAALVGLRRPRTTAHAAVIEAPPVAGPGAPRPVDVPRSSPLVTPVPPRPAPAPLWSPDIDMLTTGSVDLGGLQLRRPARAAAVASGSLPVQWTRLEVALAAMY